MTFSELVNSDKPVLIDFYADWCAPCRAMKPILETVKTQLGDGITIYKIDVDKNQSISERYQVRSIPTLILFKNGEPVWRHSGVVSAHDIEKTIQSV